MKIDEIIKKSNKHYDNMNIKYKKDIENIINNKIILKPDEYEKLGILYDNIFIWGWLLDTELENTVVTRKLLEYGSNIDKISHPDTYKYLKPLLLTSRIEIKTDIELDNLIALMSYLLKDKIKFIVKTKEIIRHESKDNYLTNILIIK